MTLSNQHFILSAVCDGKLSFPVVLWTQRYGLWSRLYGVSGPPSTYLPQPSSTNATSSASSPRFIHSRPTGTFAQLAIGIDQRNAAVYWSQTRPPSGAASNGALSSPLTGSLAVQPLIDSLSWNNNSMRSFGPADWTIVSLAVDWQTRNVYVAEASYPLIGVARYDVTKSASSQPYRILFSWGISSPSSVAVDPVVGLALFLH